MAACPTRHITGSQFESILIVHLSAPSGRLVMFPLVHTPCLLATVYVPFYKGDAVFSQALLPYTIHAYPLI